MEGPAMDFTTKHAMEAAHAGSSWSVGIHMGPEQIQHLRMFATQGNPETFPTGGHRTQQVTFLLQQKCFD